jgi:hypothetical protein
VSNSKFLVIVVRSKNNFKKKKIAYKIELITICPAGELSVDVPKFSVIASAGGETNNEIYIMKLSVTP